MLYYLWYIILLLRLYCHASWYILDQTLYAISDELKQYWTGAESNICLQPSSSRVSHAPAGECDGQAGVCVVTGGCSGIGLATVRLLLQRNMTVIVGGRTADLPSLACLQNEICCGKLVGLPLDLASLHSVKQFAAAFTDLELPLHLLINNGGVMFSPSVCTADGFEVHWGVNFLSHALLSRLLLPSMLASRPRLGRHQSSVTPHIVNIASSVHCLASPSATVREDAPHAHKSPAYCVEEAYFNSKLAVVYGSVALQQREPELRVSCLHPGVVNTDLFQYAAWNKRAGWLKSMLLMSPSRAAQHVLRVALGRSRGLYYNTSRPCPLPPDAEQQASRLWDRTSLLLC